MGTGAPRSQWKGYMKFRLKTQHACNMIEMAIHWWHHWPKWVGRHGSTLFAFPWCVLEAKEFGRKSYVNFRVKPWGTCNMIETTSNWSEHWLKCVGWHSSTLYGCPWCMLGPWDFGGKSYTNFGVKPQGTCNMIETAIHCLEHWPKLVGAYSNTPSRFPQPVLDPQNLGGKSYIKGYAALLKIHDLGFPFW